MFIIMKQFEELAFQNKNINCDQNTNNNTTKTDNNTNNNTTKTDNNTTKTDNNTNSTNNNQNLIEVNSKYIQNNSKNNNLKLSKKEYDEFIQRQHIDCMWLTGC